MAWRLLVLVAATAVLGDLTLEQHQEAGMKALTSGEFSAALEHYHKACDMAPKEYMNFMRRATVFRAQGRTRQAIKDYAHVLELRPDFTQARLQRAELLLKQGDFAEAQQDYEKLSGDPRSPEQVKVAQTAQVQLDQLEALAAAGDWSNAAAVATALVEVAPSAERVRMLRATAYEHTGQTGEAIGDYLRAAKLGAGDVTPYLRLSKLYYKMGERNDAMAQIRECLRLEEDHKECKGLYRKLKNLNKQLDRLQEAADQNRPDQALEHIKAARGIENTEPFFVDFLNTKECEVLANAGRAEAIRACTHALASNDKNVNVLEHRAKAHEALGDFANAVQDLQTASGIEPENGQLKEKLGRAQKLLKNSQKRDYYKILGVPRTATEEVITKAYRKLARENHPDKFTDEKEKEVQARRFMDIADAKEVLTDAEKRKQFDNGDDPLDAADMQQRAQHHGFHGFNGFNFFQGGGGGGGGGQQFHFRFQ